MRSRVQPSQPTGKVTALSVLMLLAVTLLILTDSPGYCCVCEEPPIIIDSLTASPTVACVGETIAFSVSAHDDDVRQPPDYPTCTKVADTVNHYSWSGGGTPATGNGSSFSTCWDTPGVKRVTVEVDDAGTPVDDSPVSTYVDVNVVEVTMTKPTADEKFTFDDATPGVCNIPCEATISPDSTTVLDWAKDHVAWSISPGVSGSTALWISEANGEGSNRGLKVTLRYTGLPQSNGSFGDHTVSVDYGCDEQSRDIQVFYPADETNHPGEGTGTSQNWYYYYEQTGASGGGISYDSSLQAGGMCDFVDGQWRAFIGSDGHHPMQRYSWNNPAYIDRFAWTSRHELKHVLLMSYMWGPTTNRNDMDDQDEWMLGDYLRDVDEPAYHRGYDPHNTTSYDDEVYYGTDPIPDAEDDCMRDTIFWSFVDVLWTNGNADSVDWANPGKQY